MIRWIPKTPAPPPQRWQSRAEILKAHLDSLPPEVLARVRPAYYALTRGWDFANHRYAQGRLARNAELAEKAGFNPDQPRVPAGNPDGGRWTRVGGSLVALVGTDEDADRHSLSAGRHSLNVAQPLQLVASRTRVNVDYSRALTGISTVDDTTKKLGDILARAMETMDFIPEWTPQQYGTAVHVAFGTMVRSARLPGIGFFDVEHSFIGGSSARHYGEQGSIRTDVVLRDHAGDIIAIYDVKTGNQGLTAERVRELRAKTGVPPSVPIIELHVRRGARLRGRITNNIPIGSIIARLWNPEYRDSWARAGAR